MKNFLSFIITYLLFSQFACQLPLNTKVLLAARHIKLTDDEEAFVRFRQLFAKKARNNHLNILNFAQGHLPAHLINNATQNSLKDLLVGMQRKAASSEAHKLLSGDDQWLMRAFVHVLRNYKPDCEDCACEPEIAQWQETLDITLSCFAKININNETSLNYLSAEALSCIELINNDADRFIFVTLGGFLLEDAYLVQVCQKNALK